MRYGIKVVVAPESDEKKETSKFSLHFEGQTTPVVLDVKGSSLLKVSRAIPDLAQDFLSIAACVYAADKALARKLQEDKWTRHIVIEIPVEHADSWSRVASELSDCIGFLTGDYWEISFRRGEKRLIQKRTRKRQPRYARPTAEAVCLFSGGLDSFIGAVDWLCDNPEGRLLLVGHYDRHVAGPAKDQRDLNAVCSHHFPDRFTFAQAQVGLSSGGADTNFRSRSLLFIALGCYFGEILGEEVPVLIPENGPIALNFPLTSARRGSCSTRTVHPQFINGLNKILKKVGIKNPVVNPYELKTKGEMVAECREQNVLKSAYSLTRSCAKANRRGYWTNRIARGCGVCVPCLFRRAALYAGGLDDEVYGKHVEKLGSLAETPSDLLALVSFLRWNPSDREIAAGLLGNGSLPLDQLKNYIGLTKRMRTEVLVWLKANGSDYFKSEVRGVLIDTHCHVDQFPSPETVVRECESNRMRVIAVTNLPSHYAMAADRLRTHPLVTAALGLHPLSASRGLRELSTFKRLAHVADFIGEIGLDFSRHGKDTRGIQERVFEEILQVIKNRPRFITLHSRGAEKAVLEGLTRNGIRGAIFHWFTGSSQDLAAVLEAGHYVSINPAMVGSESGRLVIDSAPKNLVLAESDAPLSKIDGRPSHPNDIVVVYEELAKKWQLSLRETSETIRGNFTRITDQFKIPQHPDSLMNSKAK